jgi:Phosphodiester glycosidase
MTTCTLSGRTVATDLFLDSIDAALEETPFVYTERVALGDDSKTTVHVLRQELRNTVVKVADLGSAKRVTEVCTESGGRVVAAMSGGFFAREAGMPLGELWIGGLRQSHVQFPAPWRDIRGSLLVDADGITIGRRDALPSRPDGDLLQAGPVLVTDGRAAADLASDGEGFGAASGQFDSDITDGRYPRAAIGYDDTYVYAVVVDGRSDGDVGMSLTELADFMTDRLGVTAALNLDGGGSATLAARDPEGAFHVINNPMDGHNVPTPGGSR